MKILAFLLLFLPSAAWAGWQNYTWGEPLQSVREKCQACQATSKGGGQSSTVLLVLNKYVVADHVMTVNFRFHDDSKTLAEVSLRLDSVEWEEVSGATVDFRSLLASKYGPPSLSNKSVDGGTTRESYTWHSGDDVVLLSSFVAPALKGKSILLIGYYKVNTEARDKL